MPHATPIKIPEPEFLQICAASTWLCPPDRDAFWSAVVAALDDHEVGPGAVTRAVYAAFAAYYKPIQVPDEPRLLRKVGTNKLEAHFDRIEAHRQRRQRSDAR